MNNRYIISALVALICFSCSKKNADSKSWDENAGIYYLPEMGLTYKVPYNIERWSIAHPDNLVPQIKFLGVDNENAVVVMIVTPSVSSSKIEQLHSDNIKNLIYDIIKPSPTAILTGFSPEIIRSEGKWSFNSNYSVVEGRDTVKMSNAGSFFNVDNQIAGLVVVAPSVLLDSVGTDIFRPYMDGLKYLSEE